MTISNNIISDVPIQSVTEKIGSVKNIFDELTYSHLPVEENGVYIGCISENDLRCFDVEKTLEDYRYVLSPFYARENNPLLDILKAFAHNDTNLLPILGEENNAYLGYLELNDVMAILNDTPFFGEPGTIIVVEKKQNDFSFSEVSQIVESNEGKLLGVYIDQATAGLISITLKVGEVGINEILQAFRRYGYKIVSEHQEDSFMKNLEERSNYLNKYLNI